MDGEARSIDHPRGEVTLAKLPWTRANNGLPSGVSIPIDIPRIVTVRRAQDAARQSGGRADDTDSHCARRVDNTAGCRMVVVHGDRIAIAVDGVDRDVVSGRVAVNANVAMVGPGRGGCDSKT